MVNYLFYRQYPALLIALLIGSFTATYSFSGYDSIAAQKVVKSLDIVKFKADIKKLTEFGGRAAGSQGNTDACQWLKTTFESFGYSVTLQSTYKNVYCTKTGSVSPDSVYIISAHYDGMAVAQSANDNASGCALVLQAARVLANPLVKTRNSVRFLLFNNEETGLQGSNAYATGLSSQQGKTEPVWKGIIQHDMILFDHGMPPQSQQTAEADIDVEYQANSTAANKSLALAQALSAGCTAYAPDYPAQIGSNMSNTDSDPFKNITAAVSVRDLQRLSEIGNGADPHWHKATDLYNTFSEKDFLLGFNTVQMTVGTVCCLAGVYDSLITGSYLPQKDFHPITLKAPVNVCVFDIQGRQIDDFVLSTDSKIFIRNFCTKKTMPSGVYLVRIIYPDGYAQCHTIHRVH